jgi:hypothetical protein
VLRGCFAAIALVASCSPPARTPRHREARPVREPDDTPAGAVRIPLVDNRGEHRGELDGPTSDTEDWLLIDSPSVNGRYVIELSVGSLPVVGNVWLQCYRGDGREIVATHSDTVGRSTVFELARAPARLLVKAFDFEHDAGAYELKVTFIPDPDWLNIPVPGPPDLPDARRYCAIGELSDACLYAPPCDWVHVDPDNPRCAPEYVPRRR